MNRMKAASLVLALIVLGGCGEHVKNGRKSAGPYLVNDSARRKDPDPVHDYIVKIGDQSFGFKEWQWTFDGFTEVYSRSEVSLGPLGNHRVPCSANQGAIGLCFFLATLIILPIALAVRWKKKRAAP